MMIEHIGDTLFNVRTEATLTSNCPQTSATPFGIFRLHGMLCSSLRSMIPWLGPGAQLRSLQPISSVACSSRARLGPESWTLIHRRRAIVSA
eukprot:2288889-Prymnesium_polylepis.3